MTTVLGRFRVRMWYAAVRAWLVVGPVRFRVGGVFVLRAWLVVDLVWLWVEKGGRGEPGIVRDV